eukprot:COSAG06_NODE_27014_length_603_cov_0.706349_1_plen_107_part_01
MSGSGAEPEQACSAAGDGNCVFTAGVEGDGQTTAATAPTCHTDQDQSGASGGDDGGECDPPPSGINPVIVVTSFLRCHFILKMLKMITILPRQARDKHIREKHSKKE